MNLSSVCFHFYSLLNMLGGFPVLHGFNSAGILGLLSCISRYWICVFLLLLLRGTPSTGVCSLLFSCHGSLQFPLTLGYGSDLMRSDQGPQMISISDAVVDICITL